MHSFLLDNDIVQGRYGGSTARADAAASPKTLRSVCPIVLVKPVYAFLYRRLPITGDCECWDWKEKNA